ncbi:glutathione S-transferase omega-1-like [Hyperolius riggenbachi]|uniref:glutathione S-transferase omega-1-like n=1 Tax=Hyperolius riggenbachi TaxID=752182 RepID=UPI0035A2C163
MTSSERSLVKGSAPPGPVPKGVIRLYGMRFCPYVKRVRLVLLTKGIKHEVVNINLKSKPDWFFEKSPQGLVPSLETSDGKIISESLIVCEYLDEAFPGVKLFPSDPYEKAQQKMVMEQFNGIIAPFYKLLTKKTDDASDAKEQFFQKFLKLEEILAKKKTPYFGGATLAMVDFMIWPWFEFFDFLGLNYIFEKAPHMKAWRDLMFQNPVVKETCHEPHIIQGFFKLYFQESVEAADYGLN